VHHTAFVCLFVFHCLLCLYVIQEFVEYVLKYEVSVIRIVPDIGFSVGVFGFVGFLNLSMKTLPENMMDTW